MSPASAFLFDMDGVIIDSTVTHTEAWKGYLLTHGIEIPDIEQRMLGKHNDAIVRDFFPSGDLTRNSYEHMAPVKNSSIGT